MSLSCWVFLGLLYAQNVRALVNCTLPSWSWATNSLGQNPCTMVEQLKAGCYNTSAWALAPLQQGYNYVTPQKDDNPPCMCNTVMFSLYQACTGCQNTSMEGWAFYDKFCDVVWVASYPNDIPIGTKIPHWAYLDVSKGDVFDPAAASAVVASPESTPPAPSTVSSPSSSTSATNSNQPTEQPAGSSSNPSATNSPQNSSNTGAIAGGVVGGVVGLALIAAGVFFLLRRKRRNEAAVNMKEAPFRASLLNTAMSPQNLRPYDPADPSTYPQALEQSSSLGSSSPQNTSSGASAYPHTTYPARNGYQGFAEL